MVRKLSAFNPVGKKIIKEEKTGGDTAKKERLDSLSAEVWGNLPLWY